MSGTQGMLAEMYAATVRAAEPVSSSPEDISTKAHHSQDGKGFVNPWKSFGELIVWKAFVGMAKHRYNHGLTGPATKPAVPVVTPVFPSTRSVNSGEFRATWLGHACFYVEFPSGLRVLTDPVFSARCSPVQFMGPKRYTKMPCDIADIPVVDVVVISHNHYDHLDYHTIQKLEKNHPNVHYLVPLGNKKWFTSMGIDHCTELDWWEERDIVLKPAHSKKKGAEKVADDNSSITTDTAPAEGGEGSQMEARIGFLPGQHTSNRGITDRALTLWGSWSIESGGKKVYFAGDTGYRAVPEVPDGVDDYGAEFADLPTCPAFKQIGELRGPFDLGLVPIGAYSPRSIMSPVHANPEDAVNIFIDTGCKKAIGMHWGTWVLTEEPVLEPPQALKRALKKKGIDETGVFDVCDIGASKVF